MQHDEIEEITDEMLAKLIQDHEHLAVVVCKFHCATPMAYVKAIFDNVTVTLDDDGDRLSNKVLHGLESVDDDLDRNDILMVKMSSDNDIVNLGLRELPAIVFYENGEGKVFNGNKRSLIKEFVHD